MEITPTDFRDLSDILQVQEESPAWRSNKILGILYQHDEKISQFFDQVARYDQEASVAARAATLNLFYQWKNIGEQIVQASNRIESRVLFRNPDHLSAEERRLSALSREVGGIDKLPHIKALIAQADPIKDAFVHNIGLLGAAMAEHASFTVGEPLAKKLVELQDKWVMPALLLGIGTYLASHVLPSPTDTAMTGAAGFVASSGA